MDNHKLLPQALSFLRIVPIDWITGTLEGVGENFKIHSDAWIGLELQIRTPRFSACNTNVESKDSMEVKLLVYFTLPF